MKKIWRMVPGYGGKYAASSTGQVFSFGKRDLLRQWVHKKSTDTYPSNSYFVVELYCKGKKIRVHVHQLVLKAFYGPRKPGQQARHLDGNRFNNAISNLVWGTVWENLEDRRKHMVGMKLTPDLVRYIRQSQKTTRALAAELGCAKSTVANARRGQNWADLEFSHAVDHEYWEARREHAGWLRSQGYTYREIGRCLGIKDKHHVRDIARNRFPKRKRAWADLPTIPSVV